MKKIFAIFLLALCWTTGIGTHKIAELPDIKNPYPIVVDGNDLFLVDMDDHTIHVYSIKPFTHNFSFGKKGEGPGEFKYAPLIQISSDNIIALSYTKTSWFSRDGEFVKEKVYNDFKGFNPHMEMLLMPIRENYVKVIVDHDLSKKYVYLLNSNFDQIKKMYEGLYDWNEVNPKLENFRVLNYQIDVLSYKDNIFISNSHKGFLIEVFNHTGDHLFTINKNKEIQKVNVTEYYKQKALNDIKKKHKWVYNTLREDVYSFYEFFPPIRCFHISDNQIYVTTYKEVDKKHEIVILDLKGNILKKAFEKIRSWKYYKLLGELDLYTINNGKLYELIKNQNTDIWEIHVKNVN